MVKFIGFCQTNILSDIKSLAPTLIEKFYYFSKNWNLFRMLIDLVGLCAGRTLWNITKLKRSRVHLDRIARSVHSKYNCIIVNVEKNLQQIYVTTLLLSIESLSIELYENVTNLKYCIHPYKCHGCILNGSMWQFNNLVNNRVIRLVQWWHKYICPKQDSKLGLQVCSYLNTEQRLKQL